MIHHNRLWQRLQWVCWGLLTLVPATAAGAEAGLYASWHTDLNSEPEPIYDTLKDWGDTFERGEHQWLTSEFSLGYQWANGLQLGWVARAQANTQINPDAAEIYGLIQRKASLPQGQTPVTIKAGSFSGQGLRLGYQHHFNSGWISVGATRLRTAHLTDGELRGLLVTSDDNSYQLQAEVDYVYYQEPIFKRPDIERASGEGSAFDLSLHWRPADNWVLDIRAKDIASSITWRRAPFTRAQANTERKQPGSDGYASFNPLFSGREGYRDSHRQTLPVRVDAQLTHQWGAWQAIGQWRHQFDTDHQGLGAGYRQANGHQWQLVAWPQRNSLELTWQTPRWRLYLQADRPQWQRAHSISMGIAISQ